MLCNQIVYVNHDRKKISESKKKLETARRFTMAFVKNKGRLMTGDDDDVFNRIHQEQMYEYQIDYDILLAKIPSLDGQIELIKQLRMKSKKLYEEYNHKVDTVERVFGPISLNPIKKNHNLVLTTNDYIKIVMIQRASRLAMKRKNELKEALLEMLKNTSFEDLPENIKEEVRKLNIKIPGIDISSSCSDSFSRNNPPSPDLSDDLQKKEFD